MKHNFLWGAVVVSVLSSCTAQEKVSFQSDYFRVDLDKRGYIVGMWNRTKADRNFSPADRPSPLLALYDSRLYCAVSAESLDLRSLASSLGTSVKEVQRDYGTKGFLSEPVLVIYGDGQREELGPVSVELKEEFILPLLMDYILDSLDIPDDPVPLN